MTEHECVHPRFAGLTAMLGWCAVACVALSAPKSAQAQQTTLRFDVAIDVVTMLGITHIEPLVVQEQMGENATLLEGGIIYNSNVRFQLQARLAGSVPHRVSVRHPQLGIVPVTEDEWASVGMCEPSREGRYAVRYLVEWDNAWPRTLSLPIIYRMVVEL